MGGPWRTLEGAGRASEVDGSFCLQLFVKFLLTSFYRRLTLREMELSLTTSSFLCSKTVMANIMRRKKLKIQKKECSVVALSYGWSLWFPWYIQFSTLTVTVLYTLCSPPPHNKMDGSSASQLLCPIW